MTLHIPKKIPERGFYYSYKHDPSGPIYNNAYYVSFVGFLSKKQGGDAQVVYWPLDKEAPVYKAVKGVDLKSIEEWFEEKEKDGIKVPGYELIADEEIIEKLVKIRNEMFRVWGKW